MSVSSPGPEVTNPDADGLVGGITLWGANKLPGPKYIFIDIGAQTLSRTEYSLLFSRFGTEHGAGDGSTTFGLPNYAGKFPVGYDSADADFDGVGDTGGSKTGSVSGTTGGGSAHSHGAGSYVVSAPNAAQTGATHPAFSGASGNQPVSGTSGTESSHTHSFSGSAATVPPFLVTRVILKVM